MSTILQSLGLQPIIQSPAQRFAQLERGDQAALAAPRPMARVTQAPMGYGPQRMPQAADAGQIMRDQMIRRAMAPAVPYSGPNYLDQPQQPKGFLGKLMGMSDVEAAGLGGAGRALMEASGPTAMPKTTLGMLNAALAGYNQAAQAQKQMDLQNRMAIAKIQSDRAKSGLPYQGTSMDAQDRNTVLTLSAKVRSGEATPTEESQYRMSLSRLLQPKEVKSFGEDGQLITTRVPPVDVGGAYIPEDMAPSVEQSQKPTALMEKQKARLPKLQSAAGLLNKYRRALIAAKESGLYDGIARFGQAFLPSQEMAELENMHKEVQMAIKEMEELGALVGGDFAILESLALAPNSPTALRLGPNLLLSQLDNLEERLVERISAAQNLSGLEGDNVINFQGTFRTPYRDVTKEQVQKLPPNSYFIAEDDPTGTVRFKGAM